jgi:hypothetical protein
MLKRNVNTAGIGLRVEAVLVLDEFRKAIEKIFHMKAETICKPLYFKDGIVTISCFSAAAAQEIYLREALLVCELNRILMSKEVKSIKIFR